MNALFLLGRVLFAAIFIQFGFVGTLMRLKGSVAYAHAAGVPAAGLLVPVAAVLAGAGGLMLLLGLKPRAGAWLIVLFLVPVTLFMHRFWGLPDPRAAQMQMADFTKNAALAGAALMFQRVERWPWSLRP